MRSPRPDTAVRLPAYPVGISRNRLYGARVVIGVLLAGLLVSYAALLIGLTSPNGWQFDNASRARLLAASRVEMLAGLPYDSLGTIDDESGRFGDPPGAVASHVETCGLTLATQVEWIREPTGEHRAIGKRITVDVAWTAGGGGRVTQVRDVRGPVPLRTGDVWLRVLDRDGRPLAKTAVALQRPGFPRRVVSTDGLGIARFRSVARIGATSLAPYRPVLGCGCPVEVVSVGCCDAHGSQEFVVRECWTTE